LIIPNQHQNVMFCVIHAEKIIMLLFILFVLLVNFPKFLKKKNGAPTAAMDLNFAIAILTTRPEARAELLTHGGIASALGRPVCSRLNSVCPYPFIISKSFSVPAAPLVYGAHAGVLQG
jgi:hypothetical protein